MGFDGDWNHLVTISSDWFKWQSNFSIAIQRSCIANPCWLLNGDWIFSIVRQFTPLLAIELNFSHHYTYIKGFSLNFDFFFTCMIQIVGGDRWNTFGRKFSLLWAIWVVLMIPKNACNYNFHFIYAQTTMSNNQNKGEGGKEVGSKWLLMTMTFGTTTQLWHGIMRENMSYIFHAKKKEISCGYCLLIKRFVVQGDPHDLLCQNWTCCEKKANVHSMGSQWCECQISPMCIWRHICFESYIWRHPWGTLHIWYTWLL